MAGIELGQVASSTLFALSVALSLAGAAASAHTKKIVANPTGLSLKATRSVEFVTNEGTWMSVDVSPDGRRIIFDLLGDIYTVPITGGTAKRLTPVSLAVAGYPRFSPDGKMIAFVSDAGGSNQTWVMDEDGSNPRSITPPERYPMRDDLPVVPIPNWMPDGKSLIVPQSAAANEIDLYRYYLDGKSGIPVVKNNQCKNKSASTPNINGSALYVACQGEKPGLINVKVGSGETTSLKFANDSSPVALRISPDGRWLVYATAKDGDIGSALIWLRDLSVDTHDVKVSEVGQSVVTDASSSASSEAFIKFPNFSFTPDSCSLVISSHGKLKHLGLKTGAVTDIPFRVHVHKLLGPLTLQKRKLRDGPFLVRQILEPQFSFDQKHLTFGAVGKVWISDLGTAPRRLTKRSLDDSVREFDPAFSPDGRWIAFTTWSESLGGQVWKVLASGGEPILLSRGSDDAKRAYGIPKWAPDGKRIALITANIKFGAPLQPPLDTRSFSAKGSIAWIDTAGGSLHLTPVEGLPITQLDKGLQQDLFFSRDGKRLFFWNHAWNVRDPPKSWPREYVLQSVGINAKDSSDVQTHLTVRGVDVRGMLSPDGRWLAVESQSNVTLIPLSHRNIRKTLTFTVGGGCRRQNPCSSEIDPTVIKVTTNGGLAPSWSGDGRWLNWHIGGILYRTSLQQLLSQHAHAGIIHTQPIKLKLPRKLPQGSLLLRGARIVTLSQDRVIDRGDLLIVGRRISAIGAMGSLTGSEGTTVIDVTGKTIVPGFIGLQDHTFESSPLTPFTDPYLRFGLMGGVTTAWGPGYGNETRLSRGEARKVGNVAEKRVTSPGCGIHTPLSDELDSQESIFAALQSCAAMDPYAMQEIYIPTIRIQRQWAVQAAVKLRISVSHEGSDFHSRVGELQDGFALLEHHHNGVTYRHDVIELWVRSGTALNSDGGAYVAQNAQKLLRAGAIVGVSEENSPNKNCKPCGPISGMLNNFQFAPGTTPQEALKYITINGARALGLDGDLGSIEVGKIADLVILDGNPLDDLNQVSKVHYVVQDGFVYDPATLDTTWPPKGR